MTRKSAAQIERDIDATRAEIGRSLDALKERMSPGQLLDSYLGTSRIGPALMQQGLTRTFQDYPVPAALVGAGLWMMLTGRTGLKSPAQAGDGPGVADSSAPSAIGAFANRLMGKVKAAADGTSAKATEAREAVSEKVVALRDQAEDLTDQAREKVHDTIDAARGQIDQARAQVTGYADAVKERIPAAKDSVRGGLDAAQAFITDYPLVAGALVAAVGGVLASLVPVSERERALLSGQGRKLRDVADSAIAHGKTALGNVADAAVSQTRAEIGSIAERAKQSGNGVSSVH